jgi:hypothetical protein
VTDGRRPSNRAPLITPERWREVEREVGLGLLGIVGVIALLPEPLRRLLAAALDDEPVTEAEAQAFRQDRGEDIPLEELGPCGEAGK